MLTSAISFITFLHATKEIGDVCTQASLEEFLQGSYLEKAGFSCIYQGIHSERDDCSKHAQHI